MAYATIIRGTSRHTYTVVANDGSSFSILAPLFNSLALKKGQQLTEQEFHLLKQKVSLIVTRDKALDLIRRREHGEQELILKLVQKGFDKDISQEVVASLAESHLIDDYRYARSLIESRQRSNPEGVALLRLRLKSKRVNPDAIERAIQTWVNEDDNYYQAKVKAIEKFRRKSRDSQKLLEAMMKKGFSRRDILEVLEDLDQ
jgi:regulatory protein